MELTCDQGQLTVEITDWGTGIGNIVQAREPLYTSKPSRERSGMGFTFMETFMDSMEVRSAVGEGTTVTMKKKIGNKILEKKVV
jgi:stage II sporulation protein AB (anti-sigma F factor)